MTPDQWQKIGNILHEALELPEGLRAAFLDNACSTDNTMRRQVETLLKSSDHLRSSFLRSPAIAGPALVAGNKLGSYEILSLLGAGGMGEVYRARDPKLGRDVALKVLPHETARDADRLQRFQREARTIAALSHPHIVTIFSVEESNGTHFLTMELVEGVALSQLIPRDGLPLDNFFELAIALADALAAAHEKRIVHRDLKPANVMVDKRGNVKILDFGLAKVGGMVDGAGGPGPLQPTHSEMTRETQTRIGTIVGTLPYMSPEQLRGQSVGPRSDLFSLGAVLYEMAAGVPPFTMEGSRTLTASILEASPRPVTELRADLPLGLEKVLEKCLAKDPDERYQSARVLLEALQALRHKIILGQQSKTSDSAVQGSVAVLPFTNMGADPESEFFADGITEEIINALATIEQLRVAARSSAFSFKGKHIDLRIIGERLNVRSVLTGSVRRVGNRLRITVQLQDVADGCQLWSERYDRNVEDVFAIQDEIARSIVERLKITLEGDRLQSLVKAGTKNLEAYQLYVKGRILLPRRGSAVPRAVECFERAVALDSEYALAWAGLADSYTVLGYCGYARPETCMPKGTEAARRAVALDPSLAEAHCALACACLLDIWDKEEAEREFLRALELNPRYVQARDWYALFYLQCTAGRLEEAVSQARVALQCDPLSSYAHTLVGFTCFGAGRYSDAVQACERAVELDPESFLARWCHHLALHTGGWFEKAAAVGEQVLNMSGRHPWVVMSLAATFSDWRKPADAEALYAELMARSRRGYVQPVTLAIAAAAAGVEDDAIRHAQETFEIRDPFFPLWFSKYWPYSARLYEYSRFREMIASVGRSDWLRD